MQLLKGLQPPQRKDFEQMFHIASDEPQFKIGPNTRLLSYLPPPPEQYEHTFLGLLLFWINVIKTHLQTKSAVLRSEKGRRRKIHRSSSGGSFTLMLLAGSTLNGLPELGVVGSMWGAKHCLRYQQYYQTLKTGPLEKQYFKEEKNTRNPLYRVGARYHEILCGALFSLYKVHLSIQAIFVYILTTTKYFLFEHLWTRWLLSLGEEV